MAMTENSVGRVGPSVRHQKLLNVVLDRDPISAWNEWRRQGDIQTLDYAEYRLLPLVYRRLRQHHIQDPDLDRLKGVYRHTWSKNKVHLFFAKELLAFFQENQIDALVLKGAALSLGYYRDLGLRLMADIDILVPLHQAGKALSLMERLGYSPKDYPRCRLRDKEKFRTAGAHGQSFLAEGRPEVDLHWYLARECCRVDDGLGFWERSIQIEFQGMKVRTLDPTDHLFHICLHGSKWADPAPIRWITDAAIILEQSVIDWTRILRHTQTYQVIRFMQDSFSCLSQSFHLPIPIFFLKELDALKPTQIEHREYLLLTSPTVSFIRALMRHWYNHTRISSNAHFLYRLITFPKFFQYHWALPSLWHLPTRLIRK